jgi:hypothetical protein
MADLGLAVGSVTKLISESVKFQGIVGSAGPSGRL